KKAEDFAKKVEKRFWSKNDIKSKRMLNRLEWCVELANKGKKYDSVKVMFLVAMVEGLVKLKDGRFEDIKNSKNDILFFFRTLPQNTKNVLLKSFIKNNDRYPGESFDDIEVIGEIFYDIRNSVAHGKSHYDFMFHDGNNEKFVGDMSATGKRKTDQRLTFKKHTLTYNKFCKAMIAGAIKMIKMSSSVSNHNKKINTLSQTSIFQKKLKPQK
ncbi:MAG: hypothetical protein RIQ54_629, partial [Candidatus Parcubacteria bacterium]